MEIFGFKLTYIIDAFMAIPFVFMFTIVGIPIVCIMLSVTVVAISAVIAAIRNTLEALFFGIYHLVSNGIGFLMSHMIYTAIVITWAIISYLYYTI